MSINYGTGALAAYGQLVEPSLAQISRAYN
jgi:hypothetical protein